MTRAILIITAITLASAAHAQFRTIPADAKRGVMNTLEGMTVEIDGKRVQLAAGTQIRDDRNMIVVPNAVRPGVAIKYMPDAQGQVARIWILSPQEAAQPDPKK